MGFEFGGMNWFSEVGIDQEDDRSVEDLIRLLKKLSVGKEEVEINGLIEKTVDHLEAAARYLDDEGVLGGAYEDQHEVVEKAINNDYDGE